uniref:Uncharacterized protein n=1 Tax=Candidatus Kentrum sp. TUN TaxID=2126343 RepID=A0A451AV94_9GAMM|nr:MAG: hypothetical protein BECKTUN1418F_GA0071002_12244 [Candidatus Kentron sp. TUN]VFK69942.1 MAG: hypothetical protein BECKTUN1418E_GA0071001_12222 [Candidatus Kentron sp. TUN]
MRQKLPGWPNDERPIDGSRLGRFGKGNVPVFEYFLDYRLRYKYRQYRKNAWRKVLKYITKDRLDFTDSVGFKSPMSDVPHEKLGYGLTKVGTTI